MSTQEKPVDLDFTTSAHPVPVPVPLPASKMRDPAPAPEMPGQGLTEQRARPLLKNMDYLVLEPRLRYATEAIQALNRPNACVLDIGGRIQPYRHLFDGKIERYIGLDPLDEALSDIVAVGEQLPFSDEQFDMVICTQVLSYTTDPKTIMQEIYRVLKQDGTVILSAPFFCPMHEGEHWRFMRQDLEVLFTDFAHCEIKAEGFSIAGLFRAINIGMDKHVTRYYSQRLLELIVFVPLNYLGAKLDKLSRGSERFTANYFVVATK